MSEELASALVDGWKGFHPIFSLPDELLAELKALLGFVSYRSGIRVFMDQRCRPASLALMAGKSDAAIIKYMVKKGFHKEIRMNMKQEIGARKASKNGGEHNRLYSSRKAGRISCPTSDWNYVK